MRKKQKRSTEGCSKLKSPKTRQVKKYLIDIDILLKWKWYQFIYLEAVKLYPIPAALLYRYNGGCPHLIHCLRLTIMTDSCGSINMLSPYQV